MPIGFEVAKLLFAGVSAVAAAVTAWTNFRDKQRAARAFDKTFKQVQASEEAAHAAKELIAIIPKKVIKDLEHRADRCWTGYRKVLGGKYMPHEIDEATETVQDCVCRELSRIDKLSGKIPPRWQGQWHRFECANR